MSATTIFVICSGVNFRPPKIFLDLMPITPLLQFSNRTPPKLRGGSAPDGHLLFYRTSITQVGPLLRVSTAFPLVKLPLKALENQLNQCYRDTPSRTDWTDWTDRTGRTGRTGRPHPTLHTTRRSKWRRLCLHHARSSAIATSIAPQSGHSEGLLVRICL